MSVKVIKCVYLIVLTVKVMDVICIILLIVQFGRVVKMR